MVVKHEIKSQLAKLLATEDLIVEHKKVETAEFNVHTRVLTLPMWEKASNNVYDALVSHEVGHALYTPDVEPPKDLYVPVLPDNSNGKLLFHLNPMYEKTWASVELKLAMKKGYKTTKIHSAVKYKKYTGLMKEYVGNFLKMKLENSGVKTQEECDEVNEYHKLSLIHI